MKDSSFRAILLRRIEYGDYDYIITFLTREKGKIVVMAKNAKKSVKRFSGKLELFTSLQIVLRKGRGMPLLMEANLEYPFASIRSDMVKTAYASYWAEVLDIWLEEDKKQEELYSLLFNLLGSVDVGSVSDRELGILFHMKFMEISGFLPSFEGCAKCMTEIDRIRQDNIFFDFSKGGLVCEKCPGKSMRGVYLSKGTLKQLQWLGATDRAVAARVKFAKYALCEAESFLESFLPYYLGREARSLKVLRNVR